MFYSKTNFNRWFGETYKKGIEWNGHTSDYPNMLSNYINDVLDSKKAELHPWLFRIINSQRSDHLF